MASHERDSLQVSDDGSSYSCDVTGEVQDCSSDSEEEAHEIRAELAWFCEIPCVVPRFTDFDLCSWSLLGAPTIILELVAILLPLVEAVRVAF